MADPSFALVRLLPKNALSRLVGALCRLPAPRALLRWAIRIFVAAYGVDAAESERPVEEYRTFTEFFTRRLKAGARVIPPGPRAISPVDGTVGLCGPLEGGRLLQAKGREYTLAELLGGQEAEADAGTFAGGSFATIYLAPYNYHRIHVPLGGQITGYTYVPGNLWPVNASGVRNIDKLFCVNERLTTWLSTPRGPCAVVAVGATCVGRIRALYDDVVTNVAGTRTALRKRFDPTIPVDKGGEIALFEMGSTVVLLFGPQVALSDGLVAGRPIRLGEPLEGAVAQAGRMPAPGGVPQGGLPDQAP
ncbi:MAG: archaetidylserine decarboxylase [Myxococcales bacterium]